MQSITAHTMESQGVGFLHRSHPTSASGHSKSGSGPGKIQIAARFDPSSESSDYSTDTTSSTSSESEDEPGKDKLPHQQKQHVQHEHQPWLQMRGDNQVEQCQPCPQQEDAFQQQLQRQLHLKQHLDVGGKQQQEVQINDPDMPVLQMGVFSEPTPYKSQTDLLPPSVFQEETSDEKSGPRAWGGYPHPDPVGNTKTHKFAHKHCKNYPYRHLDIAKQCVVGEEMMTFSETGGDKPVQMRPELQQSGGFREQDEFPGIGRGNFSAIKSNTAQYAVENAFQRSSSDTRVQKPNAWTERQSYREDFTGGTSSAENLQHHRWPRKSNLEVNHSWHSGYTYRGKVRPQPSHYDKGSQHKVRQHSGKKYRHGKEFSREDWRRMPGDAGKAVLDGRQMPRAGGQEMADSDFEAKQKFQTPQVNEKDLMRTEYDWQKSKIERKVKALLIGLSEETMVNVVQEIEKIVNTGVSQLAKYPWPKQLFIVLEEIIGYAVENPEVQDLVCSLVLQLEGLDTGFDQQVSQVLCKKVGDYIKTTRSYSEHSKWYSSLLGKLYLMAIESTSGLKEQVSACVHSSIEKWIIFNRKGYHQQSDTLLDSYSNCLTELLRVIGNHLDKHNKVLSDRYFAMMRDRVLTDTHMPWKVKAKLLDLMLLRAAGWAEVPTVKIQQTSKTVTATHRAVNTDTVDFKEASVQVNDTENPPDEAQRKVTSPVIVEQDVFDPPVKQTEEESVVAAANPYNKIQRILRELGLGELLIKFVENGIRDSALMADWNDLKSVLKECGFLPGIILEIQMYLQTKRLGEVCQKSDKKTVPEESKKGKTSMSITMGQLVQSGNVNLELAAQYLPRSATENSEVERVQNQTRSVENLVTKKTTISFGSSAQKKTSPSKSATEADQLRRFDKEELREGNGHVALKASAAVGGGGDSGGGDDDDDDDDNGDDDHEDVALVTAGDDDGDNHDCGAEEHEGHSHVRRDDGISSRTYPNMSADAIRLIKSEVLQQQEEFQRQHSDERSSVGSLEIGSRPVISKEKAENHSSEKAVTEKCWTQK
ncbi:uncharacterized protein [Ptychodera flava]|uniref:uncharacterized protein n=1 Tax=Ptychodera flava TaxID=63121 RepID=UPI00396A52D4